MAKENYLLAKENSQSLEGGCQYSQLEMIRLSEIEFLPETPAIGTSSIYAFLEQGLNRSWIRLSGIESTLLGMLKRIWKKVFV